MRLGSNCLPDTLCHSSMHLLSLVAWHAIGPLASTSRVSPHHHRITAMAERSQRRRSPSSPHRREPQHHHPQHHQRSLPPPRLPSRIPSPDRHARDQQHRSAPPDNPDRRLPPPPPPYHQLPHPHYSAHDPYYQLPNIDPYRLPDPFRRQPIYEPYRTKRARSPEPDAHRRRTPPRPAKQPSPPSVQVIQNVIGGGGAVSVDRKSVV